MGALVTQCFTCTGSKPGASARGNGLIRGRCRLCYEKARRAGTREVADTYNRRREDVLLELSFQPKRLGETNKEWFARVAPYLGMKPKTLETAYYRAQKKAA